MASLGHGRGWPALAGHRQPSLAIAAPALPPADYFDENSQKRGQRLHENDLSAIASHGVFVLRGLHANVVEITFECTNPQNCKKLINAA